jgi:hypothetical protein
LCELAAQHTLDVQLTYVGWLVVLIAHPAAAQHTFVYRWHGHVAVDTVQQTSNTVVIVVPLQLLCTLGCTGEWACECYYSAGFVRQLLSTPLMYS